METFKQLKKAAGMQVEGKECRLAVTGNCATQFLATAIEGSAKLRGICLRVFDADYNQVDAQLLDKDSEIYRFQPEFLLLYLSTDRLYEEFLDADWSGRQEFAGRMAEKIERYWHLVSQNSNAKVLQMNFTEINDMAFGNYSAKTPVSFIWQIRKLNVLMQEKMAEHKEVYPIDLLAIQIRLGMERFYNPVLYYHAKAPVDIEAVPYVAGAVTDTIAAIQGRIRKCVVLDLDQTLWGGVIGDDGLGGIEIGELGSGPAFSAFQRWLKQLKDRGILLGVCSKNNEETAREPFEKHEEMILRMSDLSIFVANWNDKASNIRYIQQKLNIGMDSIVFLDDNPFERDLVKTMLPEVEVPLLPEDPAEYVTFLQNSNLFEAASYSGEDRERTAQYQAEFRRQESMQCYGSIDDYLKGLCMTGEAKPFESVRFARIAQLTQRSNQFNLRTIRYTEDEIRKIAEDDNCLTLYYTLRDRFGDHGLVSVVIMRKTAETTLFIDTWLMSCRVLKRGMEEFIMNRLVEKASEKGFSTIEAEYIPTPKNSMVRDIYKTMGFSEVSKDRYCLDVDDYEKKMTFIKENGYES